MKLTAVLLAGGNSSRMGVDKATLEIDGVPLWSRQLELLRMLTDEKVLLSARVRPAWYPGKVKLVRDVETEIGPLGGLDAVSHQVKTSHFLTLAVDMPRMTLEHLQKLWSQVAPGVGVCAIRRGRYEPLCAIYPAVARATIRKQIAAKKFSLQDLMLELKIHGLMKTITLSHEEIALYENLNTPEDFERFVKG